MWDGLRQNLEPDLFFFCSADVADTQDFAINFFVRFEPATDMDDATPGGARFRPLAELRVADTAERISRNELRSFEIAVSTLTARVPDWPAESFFNSLITRVHREYDASVKDEFCKAWVCSFFR